MDGSEGLLFEETQRFSPVWLGLTLGVQGIVLTIIGFAAFFAVPERAAEAIAAFAVACALVAGVGVTLGWLLRAARLVVEVRGRAVAVRFAPFHRTPVVYEASEILRCEAVEYRPIRDYGGWGLRGSDQHRCFNARGHRGVRLELVDGRRVLLGSQRPEELAAAIARAMVA
jgi:hypothetical protein